MSKQKGYTIIELMISILAIATVFWVIGGMYVFFHFVAKFW